MNTISSRALIGLQIRVVVALLLRETRATFGTSSFGYVWAILTPTASVALLVFIFSLVNRQPPFGASLALFFGTGIFILQFYTESARKLMNVFDANKALLTYPVIKELDTLFARSILITITNALILFVFFGSLVLLDLAFLPNAIEQCLLAFFATALLGIGMGSSNAIVNSFWPVWAQIEKVISRPLFFLSGIFYVPSLLPPEALAILKWNPVLHLIEWFREGYYPNYHSLVLDKSYPVYLGLSLFTIGLVGERLFRKRRY